MLCQVAEDRVWRGPPPAHLSTGCTEGCGNVDYSTFANSEFFLFCNLAGCPDRPYIPSCAERGAGVGRSSTGRSYGAARKGRNGKSTGAVDETATGSANFFCPSHPAARGDPPRLRSPRCRFLRVLRASTRE